MRRPFINSEYYISQADKTLVRETGSGTLSLLGITITEHVASDYTNYAEAVHVKLPKACSGKALETVALAPDLRQPLSNPAIWLPLVSFSEVAPSLPAGGRAPLPGHR